MLNAYGGHGYGCGCGYVHGGGHYANESSYCDETRELGISHWQQQHPRHQHLLFERYVQSHDSHLHLPSCGGGELPQRCPRLLSLLRLDGGRGEGPCASCHGFSSDASLCGGHGHCNGDRVRNALVVNGGGWNDGGGLAGSSNRLAY